MSMATHRLATWTAAILVVAALVAVALALAARSLVALAAVAPLLPAAALAGLAALHLAALQREQDEARDRAAAEAAQHRLFEDGARFLDAARGREQFERWFVPAACLALALLELALARWLWRGQVFRWGMAVDAGTVAEASRTYLAALLGGLAFAAFAAGRVLGALAGERKAPALRPTSHLLLLTVGTGCGGVAWSLWPGAEATYAARGVAVLLVLVAVDRLLTLGLDWYRSRGSGPARVVYEGRLLALLVHPAGIVDNLAATLDYQFGWKVSRTQFYGLARRALLPFLLFQAAALWLLSCLLFVGPDQVAVRYRLGRPTAPLGPGFHLLAPWPVDRHVRLPARQVQTITLGPAEALAPAADELYIVAAADAVDGAPADLLQAELYLSYELVDPRRWLESSAEPERLLADLLRRETARCLAGSTLYELLGGGESSAAEAIARGVAAGAEAAGLGVVIRGVGFVGSGPPAPVREAFEAVTQAGEQQSAAILAAEAAAAHRAPEAEVAAEQARALADGRAARTRATASARRGWFAGVLSAARAEPRTFRTRRRLQALEAALAGREKTVVTVPVSKLTMDLEERARTELLDAPIAPPETSDE